MTRRNDLLQPDRDVVRTGVAYLYLLLGTIASALIGGWLAQTNMAIGVCVALVGVAISIIRTKTKFFSRR